MSHKIVFLERGTLGVPLRTPNFPHTYTEYDSTLPEQVLERIGDADIAIINKSQLRAPLLEKMPNLKLIAVAATGTDCVDKKYCREHGITVSNIRNYAENTVPEHVIALMFALRRSLIAYHQDVQNGVWQKSPNFCFFPHTIRDLAGSTFGVVGYGALGKSVAKRAEALGMKILKTDYVRTPDMVDLETLLRESDVITLHCPLTDETKQMINAERLAMMKKDAILINTARGGLIDEPALVAALRGGTIGGAGIDVLPVEPPREGNLLLDPTIPNLLVTPHVAWASIEARTALAAQLIDNVEAWAAGSPRNVVLE